MKHENKTDICTEDPLNCGDCIHEGFSKKKYNKRNQDH